MLQFHHLNQSWIHIFEPTTLKFEYVYPYATPKNLF